MEIHEIRSEIKKMSERISQFKESLNVDEKESRIKEYEQTMQESGFWDDRRKAQEVINAANALKEKVSSFYNLEAEVEELAIAFELIQEESDEELQLELESQIHEVSEKLNAFELEILLSGPYDGNNAILELHPGAGGTESQDWAEMLYRMYTRYAGRKGFKVVTFRLREQMPLVILKLSEGFTVSFVFHHLIPEDVDIPLSVLAM